jgi:membrane protein
VRLKQSDLLLMLEDDAGYVLAHDTDKILLTDILQAIRSAGDQPDISVPQIADNSAVASLLNQMEGHTAEFLMNRSLRDMV